MKMMGKWVPPPHRENPEMIKDNEENSFETMVFICNLHEGEVLCPPGWVGWVYFSAVPNVKRNPTNPTNLLSLGGSRTYHFLVCPAHLPRPRRGWLVFSEWGGWPINFHQKEHKQGMMKCSRCLGKPDILTRLAASAPVNLHHPSILISSSGFLSRTADNVWGAPTMEGHPGWVSCHCIVDNFMYH